MKMFLMLLVALVVTINVCTPAQARSDYEITWTASADAVKYLVFLEERVTNTGFTLLDNMDYLDPVSMLSLKLPVEPAVTNYTIKLSNDSRYVVAGVVAVDVVGYYSVMGVSSVVQKGKAPGKPGTVVFKKK